MNEYKISLSHDLVFHKRSNGVCTVTQGTDILPIELETAVNLLAEEIIEQQDKIDENKRQQEVTVHQFRQAQEEIRRLQAECSQINEKFKKVITVLRDIREVTKIGSAAYLFAKNTLAALEGDAK